MTGTFMKRRRLVTGALALFAVRMPVNIATADAAGPGRARRVGGLVYWRASASTHIRRRLEEHLLALGRRAPDGVEYHWRFGDYSEQRLPALAAELVQELPDVLFGWGNTSTAALARATSRVPIVGIVSDPVRLGLSKSAVRPSGNVTGQMDDYGTTGKIMDLVRRMVPKGAAIAIVYPTQPADAPALTAELEAAARKAGLEPRVGRVTDRAEFEATFRVLRGQGVRAAIIPYWFLLFEDAKVLTRLAIDSRIALVDQVQSIAGAGALLTYQADYGEILRRMAIQIDKILRGVPLREIPFEQPTRYRLEINRATAIALGLEIPPDLILLADKIHD